MDTQIKAWSELLDWGVQSAGDTVNATLKLQEAMTNWWIASMLGTLPYGQKPVDSSAAAKAPSTTDEYLQQFDLGCPANQIGNVQ